MPLYSVYSQALEQDLEQSAGVQQDSVSLQNKTFIQVALLSSATVISVPLRVSNGADGP